MAKVKIVQMTLSVATDSVNGLEERAEYLDDKGRVWYQIGKKVNDEWVTEWCQLPLPNEPEGAEK